MDWRFAIAARSFVSMFDRREFLAAAGTLLGAAYLDARPEDLSASVRAGVERPPLDILTPEQAADLDALSVLIIPTDDLPGAREAGVVNFVDKSLGTWAAGRKDDLVNGLNDFNSAVAQRYSGKQRFAQLTPDQQLEFARDNEHGGFFQAAIFMTVAGTFSYPDWGGNKDKAGWRILGFQDAYVWQPPFGWYDDKANGGPN
ncbi:MAG TPA: gluconate 2-dehydrogenase subunit 3 family protein [Gemmatimonadales bacterium]|jgi:gluconate 2-dehydrogenase gamma chain